MKFRWVVVALTVVVVCSRGAVRAQSLLGSELPPTSVMPAEPQTDTGARTQPAHLVLDDYLRHHPKLSRKLHRNPELLNDPRFERTHPELEQFIARHPGSREEFEGAERNQSGKHESPPHALALHPR